MINNKFTNLIMLFNLNLMRHLLKRLKAFLDINSQPGSYTTSCKCGSKHLNKEIVDTSQIKKKGKNYLVKNKLY